MPQDPELGSNASNHMTSLDRGLNLPLLTLYGLGVTIGAGIYVLVGATAAKAGLYAPVSFLIAATVVAFTGFSYSELGTRYPVSAGEAAYVRHGLKSGQLALIVGLMVVGSGVISSAAIAIGAAAYLKYFISLSPELLIGTIILVLGAVAIWGIVESVMLAAIFTIVEIGGLGLVVYFGISQKPDLFSNLSAVVPPFETTAWVSVMSASLLAFFAFVGFEDIANVAEEVRTPRKTLPKAILLTLIVATILYVCVVSVVVLVVPMETLVASDAPLALIFTNAGTSAGTLFNIIGCFATINGVLVQMIMASRVVYGLASQGSLPAQLAYVNPSTRTPIFATLLVTTIILTLALLFPIALLAQATSTIVLLVFVSVNLALLRLKWSSPPPSADVFEVPFWVPAIGLISCVALLSAGWI